MATSTPPSSESPRLPSWSGRRKPAATTVRHRWQAGWSEMQRQTVVVPRQRLRRRIAFWLLLSLLLFGLFVYALLYSPVKTPLLAIAATDYSWPLPPNGWVQEDVTGLQQLHGRTLDVIESSEAWRSKQLGLEDLERRLREIAQRERHHGAVIIYLSMHGAVNEFGVPCLIPPGTSPWNSAQWLTVPEVLQRIETVLPRDLNKLVLLDCTRQRVNWNVGLLYNTFAERLRAAVEGAAGPRLAVISASGPGEQAWSSPDLRGSAFGRFVGWGLAGLADRAGPERTLPGGDGDGYVTVAELGRYVQREVSRWSWHNRGESQTPQIISANDGDFRLTLSMNRWNLRSIVQQATSTTRAADSVSQERISQLWQQLDALREFHPYQVDPLAWRDFEHQLLWLEHLAVAGGAYDERAERLQTELAERLERVRQQMTAARGRTSIVAWTGALAERSRLHPPPVPLHSLALTQYFGQLDAKTADNYRARLAQLADPRNTEDLDDVLRGYPEGELLSGLLETQLLRLARKYDVATLWTQGDLTRDVIRQRDLWEQWLTFGDERAQYALRDEVELKEEQRRLAEDRWLAGDASSDSTPAEQMRALLPAGEGAAPKRSLEAALLTRDRVWAELPYLAQHLCLPQQAEWREQAEGTLGGAPYPGRTAMGEAIQRQLLPLLVRSRELGEALASGQAASESSRVNIQERAQQVAALHEALVAGVRRHEDSLLDDQLQDAASYRSLGRLLAVPLTPWQRRLTLRQKQAALGSALHAGSAADPLARASVRTEKEDPPASPPRSLAALYLEDLLSWEVHPALSLLHLSVAASADERAPAAPAEALALVEQQQRLVRDRLSGVGALLPSAANPAPGEAPWLAARRELNRAAQLVRIAAPLAVAAPEQNPIEQLRRFDLQQLLLWQARRMMDDFWNTSSGAVPASEQEPFFDVAANDYLQAARLILPLSAGVEAQLADLERLLNRRRFTARRGIVVSAEARPQDEPGQMGADVTLRSGLAASEAGEQAVPALPAGTASLFVRQLGRRLPGIRGLLPLPLPPAPVQVPLSGPLAEHRTNLQVVTLFRGNEFVAPLVQPDASGVVVDLQPHVYDSAQVTLFGDRRQKPSIVFILDCSWSMRESISVEAQGRDQLPRIEIAKSALNTMLSELAVRADARVGVRFFGHRIGWTTSDDPKAVVQPAYAGEIPDDLVPSEDVELVLPLGRFESIEAAKVADQLASVQPWGQSPLYLAITQAVEDFAGEEGEAEKSIVVITDGANYQFSPANSNLPSGPARSLDDARRALAGQGVGLYIVGFGLGDAATSSTARDFTRLATETGGRYYPAGSGTALLEALRSRLTLGGYLVLDEQGNAVASAAGEGQLTRLNSPVALPLPVPPERERRYQVSFEAQSQVVAVEGGEALELFVSRSGDLVARPYDRDFPVTGRLVDGDQAGAFLSRVHRPLRVGNDVEFPISLQHASLPFTPRPHEVWMEISPAPNVANDESGLPTYVFYDANFEPGTPVPVLVCRAARWPAGFNRARVQTWIKYSPTLPLLTLPLPELLAADKQAGTPVPDVRGVVLRADVAYGSEPDTVAELKIVEEHASTSAGVRSLKVQLELPRELQPARITRRFDEANGRVVHTFAFTPEAGRQLLKPAVRVQVTSRAAALSEAWELENNTPIVAEIFSRGDLLPADAATGGGRR